MNKCNQYDIECPYKLSDESPLPCFATQEQCNTWREKK